MLNSGMFTSDTSEWATPQDFFDKLNAEFHFTLDPCATPENAKCGKFYTKEQNGLAQDWTGETVFCNPPYGKEISAWVEKCYKHSLSGEYAVMLIPSRTDTRWFHEWVYGKAELRFVKGRLRFNDSKGSAPFPSLVVVYRGATHDEKLPPAQLSTDLISRQAAIAHAVPLNLFGREVMMVSVSELENLPSAQPEHTETHSCDYERTATHGWIPVTERQPEDGVTVWVTIKGHDVIRCEDGETLEQAIARISKIRWVTQGYWSEEEHGWNDPSFGCPLMVQPVAWMPMGVPEPWRGGQDDES